MDAQQLFDGIARAVELAKPADQLCLIKNESYHLCMNLTEGAAWFQAIFAIFAILVTQRISSRTERLRARENIVRGQIALSMSFSLISSTADTLKKFKEVYPRPTRIYRDMLPELSNIIEKMHFLDVAELVDLAHLNEGIAMDLADAAGKMKNVKIYLYRIERMLLAAEGFATGKPVEPAFTINCDNVFRHIYLAGELYESALNAIVNILGPSYKNVDELISRKDGLIIHKVKSEFLASFRLFLRKMGIK